MYSVNGKVFNSYFQAIEEGQKQNAQVIQVDNGQVRWEPLPPVSKKRFFASAFSFSAMSS